MTENNGDATMCPECDEDNRECDCEPAHYEDTDQRIGGYDYDPHGPMGIDHPDSDFWS